MALKHDAEKYEAVFERHHALIIGIDHVMILDHSIQNHRDLGNPGVN